MTKKYEIRKDDYRDKSDFIEGATGRVYRIVALVDIPLRVRAGEEGGYIESEDNLSHLGRCWVADDAVVCDNAFVGNNAHVCGDAVVSGNSHIDDNAAVYEDARIGGDALVCSRAEVYGDATVEGVASVYGSANICSGCYDSGIIYR